MSVAGFTVYDLLVRNAQLHAKRPAVVFEGRRQTFAELMIRVDSLAAGLVARGLQPGQRVCILAQNDPGYLELYGACARQGLIAYPINWRLSSEEVGRVLERAQPVMMVVDTQSLGLIGDWASTRKDIPHWYQFGAEAAVGMQPFETLYADVAPPPRPEVSPDDTFCVISTAAVDIIPRGAALSHANVLAANLQAMALMGVTEADVNIVALPLFHIAALGMTLAVMHAGGCNVVMPKYDPAEAVHLIDEYGGTHISDFPPVLLNLLGAAEKAKSQLASLRIVSGLESPDTIELLHKRTGAQFWTGFGQSETTGFVTLQPVAERPGAAGRPGPLAIVRLVDDYDSDVSTGQPGEILVRGPLVMKEYYGQPDVTEHTFRGGWHHTGDVGRFDDDGYLHYVRRKPEKELIKPGGENVYPAEVESVIMEIAGVEAVCVFGVPDAEWGEAVRAVVQAPQGHALSEPGVIDHVGGRIARFKRPKRVFFTNVLPRTDGGGIDREAVKQAFGEAR
ncbi:MAG TPA: AMP-binding protein [bacterium]|nr:AMP-binding protein [bacterium]